MKILAALDRSDHAWDVLEKALEMAKFREAQLLVLTVAEEVADFGESGMSMALTEAIEREVSNFLAEVNKRTAGSGLKVKTMKESSHSAAEAILRVAEAEKVELIVMGHQGKSALDRFFIGSVASKVVSHAPCSVFVVR
ncbi:universal stress protein [Fundidesulfovibrio butyratiphilus]